MSKYILNVSASGNCRKMWYNKWKDTLPYNKRCILGYLHSYIYAVRLWYVQHKNKCQLKKCVFTRVYPQAS